MKKKILLPTDFSKNAWNALKYASELYKNEEVDFYLLNTFMVQNYSIETMMVPEPGEKNYDEGKSRSELELKKLLKRIEILKIPSNHTYFTESVFNFPLEAVKTFVEDKDIDLVIAGNKGETDTKDVLIGSNSIDFMEEVRNCPVFMIPAGATFKEPNEIVFPTSFKTHFKSKELKHLFEISRITNAPVRILHMVKEKKLTPQQNNNKNLLEDCFEGMDYSFHYLENLDVKNGLLQFVTERSSEMIAFINKKHTFLDSIFSNPMVNELGQKAAVPTLALHDLRN